MTLGKNEPMADVLTFHLESTGGCADGRVVIPGRRDSKEVDDDMLHDISRSCCYPLVFHCPGGRESRDGPFNHKKPSRVRNQTPSVMQKETPLLISD